MDPYTRNRIRKLLLIVIGIFLAITIAIFVIHLLQPESQQSKYIKSATAAARKQTPNATVTNVRVAGGFATATVSAPTTESQESIVSTAVFKVNKDGSMVQIASGSSFSPLDLLEIGVPLTTQAKLNGSNKQQVIKNLANQCGYDDGALGFDGFDGSFNPNGWQIDAATLNGLEQKLTAAISNQDASSNPVICVKATQKNSNISTNKTTYISTFTLRVQFVASDGTLTTHTVTFTNGSPFYRTYTLDGRNITSDQPPVSN